MTPHEALVHTIRMYERKASEYEAKGECEGARQLRAVSNTLGLIVEGKVPGSVNPPVLHVPLFPVGHRVLDAIAVDLTVALKRFPTWEEVEAEATRRINAELDLGEQ